jgi:multiple sugar transport system substrate-binding protein
MQDFRAGDVFDRPLTRRHLIQAGLTVSVAGSLLSACGGDDDTEGGQAAVADSFAGITITVATAGTPKQTVERAIPVWEARTKGKVKLVEISYTELDTKYASIVAASDSTYDVLYGGGTQLGKYRTQLYQDMTPLVDDTSALVPATVEAMTFDDKLLGLPIHSEMMVFIFNRRMFEDAGVDTPPDTWQGLIDLSPKLRSGRVYPCVYPVLAPGGFNARSVFLIMLNSTPSPLISEDGRSVGFDNEDGLLVFQTLEAAFGADFFDPEALFLPSSYDSALLFNQGRAACQPHFSELWGHAVSGNPEFKAKLDPADVDASIMPGLRSGTSGSVDGVEGHGISRFSEQQEAALSFIQETVSQEVQLEANLQQGGLASSRTDVLNDDAVREQFAVGAVMAEQGSKNLDGYFQPYSDKLYPIFEDVLVRLHKGDLNAQSAHTEMVGSFQRVIDEFHG